MRINSAIAVLAARALQTNKPTVCNTSPTIPCPSGLSFSNGFCNNCDSILEEGGVVFCNRTTRYQFIKEALPFCSESESKLPPNGPWACQSSRCAKGITSDRIDDRTICFNCDETNLNGRKCSAGGDTITIDDAQALPFCFNPGQVRLPVDYPSVCKGYSQCPLGTSTTSYQHQPICHNCDEVSLKDNKFKCSKNNRTIHGELSFVEGCQSSSPTVPDLFKSEPVLCANHVCASYQSSLKTGDFLATCHNCDSLTKRGSKTLICERNALQAYFESTALPRCGSKPTMDLKNPALCKGYTCPLGAMSAPFPSGGPDSPNLCHSCTNMVLGFNGNRTCHRGSDSSEFNDAVVPKCANPRPSDTLSNETHICKSRIECPFGIPSYKASNGMFLCSTCDRVSLDRSNISCQIGLSLKEIPYDKVEPCFFSDPLPNLSEALEGGACIGDYSCPAGTQKLESQNTTFCHNCDSVTQIPHFTCLKNNRRKVFELLPKCGPNSKLEPYESLSESTVPYTCNRLFFDTCPLLAQSAYLGNSVLVCHNCDFVSNAGEGQAGYKCTRGNRTTLLGSELCRPGMRTFSPTTLSPTSPPSGARPTVSDTERPSDASTRAFGFFQTLSTIILVFAVLE